MASFPFGFWRLDPLLNGGSGFAWTGQYSYEFDGVNESIELKDFPTIASDYSFIFWFKTSSGAADQYILGSSSATYNIKMNFGQLQVESADNSFDITGAAVGGLADSEWHYVAYTYNRTTGDFKCYIDGVLKVTNSATTGVNIPPFTKLGSNNAATKFYTGRIDEFVVFTSELDATDITTLYNNSFPAEVTSPAPANYMYLGDGDTFVKTLDFDGVNEYTIHGDVLDFNGSTPFSFDFWVRPGDTTGLQDVLSKFDNTKGYLIRFNGTSMEFILIDESTNQLKGSISGFVAGNLYHVMFAYDGSKDISGLTAYINGSSTTVTNVSNAFIGSASNSADLTMGIRSDITFAFHGELQYVSAYNTELTSGDATTLYNSGVPKLATALGLSPTNEWDLTKEFKKSLTFDGVNEYIGFGNNIDKEKTDAFSLSTWVKIGSNHIGSVISKELNTGNKEGYLLYLSTNKFIFYLSGDNSSVDRISRDSSGTFNLGELYHIACTYDGSNTSSGINFYVNGVLANGAVQGISMIGNMSNTADFNIGSRDNGNVLWDGEIGISSVFDSELTAENVATLYNGGVPDTAVNLGLTPTNEWDIYNEDVNYFDGTNHAIVDQVGSIDGTSVNMESADVTDVFWAIRDEVGSLDGKSVNMESTDATGIGWAVEDSVGTLQGLSVNMEEADRKMGVAYSANFNDGVTGELINWGNVLDKDGSEDFSISIWVWADITSMPTNFLEWLGKRGAGAGWALRANTSETIFFLIGDGTNWNQTRPDTDFNMAGWNHWVVCYDSSKAAADVTWYKNGVLKTTNILTDTYSGGGSASNTESLRLGSINGEPSIKATRLSIHNKKLNQLEINALYNNGVPVTAFEAGLSASAELDCIMFGSEDTATTIKDYSGNGYNGTLTNMDLTNKSSDTP